MTHQPSAISHEPSAIRRKIFHIARRYEIEDLYVFGSRASEILARFDGKPLSITESVSDIDFGIFPAKLEEWDISKRVRLSIELEDLFHVGRVDLVMLPEADPYLALDIIRGELLYSRQPDQQARYELFVLRRAADLIFFKRERTRMILEEGAR